MAHTAKEYIELGREILARPLTWLVLVIAGWLLLGFLAEGAAQQPGQIEERIPPQAEPPQAEWKWHRSSNLVQYYYNEHTKVLSIIFHGDRLYRFHDVPPDVAN
jgi:KTSC domain